MTGQDRSDEAVDRLVRQYLASEEGQVHADALIASLERRSARRQVVRLYVRVSAAAATVLIALGLLVTQMAAPPALRVRPVPADGQAALAQQAELVAALRGEVEAAVRDARSSGAAAVSAGAAALTEVASASAEVSQALPELIDRADSALDRFLKKMDPHSGSDKDKEENSQWKL